MIYGHPKHLLSESEAVQALTSYSGIAVITTAAAGRLEASQNAPWQITDAPARYIEQQLAGIIGIEVEISEISAKRKMSQEKSAADRQGVIANLNCSDDAENNKVGALMAQLETRQ